MSRKPIALLSGLLAVGLGLFLPSRAEALSIKLSDGVNAPVEISASGTVTYTGSLGVWTLLVTTGSSYPDEGSISSPSMTLSVTAKSTGSGNLRILLSEQGFDTGAALAVAGLATSGTGTTNYFTYQDVGNGLFAQTPPAITTLLAAGSASGLVAADSSYSLTQKLTISRSSAGTSTALATLTVPDGGLSVALLGFALVSIEGLRRKFVLPGAR